MTNEQLLVYLYGIYPEGGWSMIWVLLLSISIIFLATIAIHRYDAYNSENENSDYHYTKSLWYKSGNLKWVIPSTLALFLFLANLVPDKKTFLLLVATPTVVESITGSEGKLNKLNTIVDKALDKADKYLDQNN
jgi:hypothetical protein